MGSCDRFTVPNEDKQLDSARTDQSNCGKRPNSLVVVGIGASAGGLAALRQLFENLPSDPGLAFVVIVHLSADHESHLAEILQPHAKMPVVQVKETTELRVNQIHVIPPGRNLTAVDTHLRLDKLEAVRSERAPIDHFFRTLAKTHDGHSIGVILTGTGSDGTLGLKAIKGSGGMVIVQDPNDAEYDGMPQSAVATGMADVVLPLLDIPTKLLTLGDSVTRVQLPTDEEAFSDDDRNALHKIFAQVRTHVGRDFTRYKRSTIMRRIGRRMQLSQIANLTDYLDRLRTDLQEVRLLADDLLITVTNFFRDEEVFKLLENEIVPQLFQDKRADDEVRVWSVGCSTGEEAYSLAILLLEEASKISIPPRIQVFASDLHEHSLGRARDGFYPGDIATDVSPERLRRFFVKEDGGYRIRREVRELVVFTPHNLMGDPPFSRLDFISCRNVLIYLQRDVQNEIVELFHYSLRPDGVLLLGTSETSDDSELFQTLSKKLCVYRKRNVPPREPRLPVFPLSAPRLTGYDRRKVSETPLAYGVFHAQMVELYAPPSMLVTPDDKVVHLSEHAGRYLTHPGGELTANALKLVREEFRIELHSILHLARKRQGSVRGKPIIIALGNAQTAVTLEARPAADAERKGFVLVIFSENAIETTPLSPMTEATDRPLSTTDNAADEQLARHLQSELDMTQQRLQVIVHDYEASQEDMQASNEELQSANEELRSTMEELETSKEELQSMNEELQTVNQENRHKVDELAQLSSDLQNLLAATNIATLFLDRDLRILRFTPATSDLFNIRAVDCGRPISDLTHCLGYAELMSDCQQLLKDLVPIEREIQDHTGRWFLTRLLPYRSKEDRIDGVVITFIDITQRKASEADLRQSQQRYRLLVESATEYAIIMLDANGEIQLWNRGAERMFGFTEEEVSHKPGDILWTPEDQAAGVLNTEMQQAIRDGHSASDRWRRRKDGSLFRGGGVVTAIQGEQGQHAGFAVVMRDNTERAQSEELLRESEARLRLACEAAGFGSYDYDIVNQRSVWSPELLHMLHLPDSAKIDRNTLSSFVHPDDKEDFSVGMERSIQAEGEGRYDRQFRVIIDGRTRWMRDVGHTFFVEADRSKRAARIVGMLQDVTAQKDRETSLEHARAVAEAASQSRGEFLANMSHEIRTPMTAILGHVDILSEMLDTPDQRKYLETVRQNGRFLLGILNDILDLSKIDAGKLSIAREPVELARLLANVRSLMDVRAAEKGVTLSIEFITLVPESIQSDATRLRQILLNLLGNALKFTHSGTVRLVVAYRAEASQLQFDVIDTGIGISRDRIDELFQPFSQADTSNTRHYGGTGLGLVICRRLAKMFGGDISVESTPGIGSTFTLAIECRPSEDIPHITPDLTEYRVDDFNNHEIELSGNILVADDRRDIRFLATRLLEKAGASTVTADNGRHAVELVAQSMNEGESKIEPFDAILMDMQMPEMDGYEAARRIRELGYNGPIIALTANAMQGDRDQCVAAGCNDYLTKPINGPEMLKILLSQLERLKS